MSYPRERYHTTWTQELARPKKAVERIALHRPLSAIVLLVIVVLLIVVLLVLLLIVLLVLLLIVLIVLLILLVILVVAVVLTLIVLRHKAMHLLSRNAYRHYCGENEEKYTMQQKYFFKKWS